MGGRPVAVVLPSLGQGDPSVVALGTGRLAPVHEDCAAHGRTLVVDRCHLCPQCDELVDRDRFEKIELQRRRAVRERHRLLDRDALVSARGGSRGPERMADDHGRDDAALEPAGQSDVKRLRLPPAHDLIAVPSALDLEPVLVRTAAPVAMPVDQILEGLEVHGIAPVVDVTQHANLRAQPGSP